MLLLEEDTQCRDVMKTLLSKCDVNDIDIIIEYFGIFQCPNGSHIEDPVSLDQPLVSAARRLSEDSAKLVFMIRLFMPSITGLQFKDVVAVTLSKPKNMLSYEVYLESAQIIDVNLLHLQYIQAVYHVITGQYPTSQDQALILGALHFLFKFGEYNNNKHKLGFLGNRIVEFIPVRYLKKKSLEEWESILYQTLQNHQDTLMSMTSSHLLNNNGNNNDSNTATLFQHKYMDNIFRLPNGLFGCTFFRVTSTSKNLPETVIVGINSTGINIYDKSSDRKLLYSFHIEEIFRWGYKPKILFYFEIKAHIDLGTAVEFKTGEGAKMSDLMTDYALAYLKDKGREDKRSETLGTISVTEYLEREKQLKELSNTVPIIPKMTKKINNNNGIRKTYTQNDRIKAAIKVQSRYRGYALRSQWAYEDGAIRIQALYRGYRARMRVFKMIEKLMAANGVK